MESLREIPIIKQALFLMQEAGSTSGIKITETGALGRNFVQALWDQYLKTSDDDKIFRPTRELECPEATKLRFLLSELKYIRKYKGKVILTEKGRTVLREEKFEELYRGLFTIGITGWNWGYEDRYPDFDFIQGSARLLIHYMHSESSGILTAEKLFDEFFEEVVGFVDADIKDQIQRCLLIRFFYRFCIPFGILSEEEGDRFFSKNPSDHFEKTKFFISQGMSIFEGTVDEAIGEAADQKVGSMMFTKDAKKIWSSFDPKFRMRVLNNVFCSTCGVTGMGNVTGKAERKCLILHGDCTKCGEAVVRLIEIN